MLVFILFPCSQSSRHTHQFPTSRNNNMAEAQNYEVGTPLR